MTDSRVASLAALLQECVRSLEFAEIWLRKIGDTDGANAMLRTLEKARGVRVFRTLLDNGEPEPQ